MNSALLAYKNDPELKSKFVAELNWHREQDKIIHGHGYGSGSNGDFQGCAIGCAIHSLQKIQHKPLSVSSHALIEENLDIPVEIAHLIDGIFESLPDDKGSEFTCAAFAAIQPGADLSMVIPHWIYWTLSDEGSKPTAYPQFQPFIDAVVALYEEWTRTGVRPSESSDLAYLANRADLAYLANRADLAERSSEKLIDLLRNAPVASTRPGVVGTSDAQDCERIGGGA